MHGWTDCVARIDLEAAVPMPRVDHGLLMGVTWENRNHFYLHSNLVFSSFSLSLSPGLEELQSSVIAWISSMRVFLNLYTSTAWIKVAFNCTDRPLLSSTFPTLENLDHESKLKATYFQEVLLTWGQEYISQHWTCMALFPQLKRNISAY